MIWINLGIIVVYLCRVCSKYFTNQKQPKFELATGSLLFVGALGYVLFGYSNLFLGIQGLGLLLAVLQGVTGVWYRYSSASK